MADPHRLSPAAQASAARAPGPVSGILKRVDVAFVFQSLGISLGLGLLVGLQRERVDKHVAGVRTFPLITILGTLSALTAQELGGWIVAAALAGVMVVTVLGNIIDLRKGEAEAGVTTEMAILAMFLVGVFVVIGPREAAVATGAGVAVLLHAKAALHAFVNRLGDKDVRAVMQFALITLVILPVLPNQTFGPYDVLNPRNIWLMVVLVSGISFGGYVLYKAFGAGAGMLVGGLLGGAISSTATTVSYAQRVRDSQAPTVVAAVAIMLASTVSIVRVLIEIAVVAPEFFKTAAIPIGAVLASAIVISAVAWLVGRSHSADAPEQDNPVELKPALIFGALYALILLAIAAAKTHLGDQGLYAVAIVSGMTDMDAITLSTSRLVERDGQIEPDTAWRVIVLAMLSNQVFKAIIAGAIGGKRLVVLIAPMFGALLIAGGLVLLLF